MDNNKKQQQNYARTSNTKACLPVDSNRKSSDSQVNKQRNSRRREQVSTPRNEQQQQRSSKQQTQQQQQTAKLRPNVDKRPKPRGGGSNAANGGWSAIANDESACPGDDYTASSTRLATAYAGAGRSVNYYNDYELNSVYAPGSKKQNLNHLLNFHYSPRDGDYGSVGGGGLSAFGRHQRAPHHHHHASAGMGALRKHRYNKEQFLQANFQFVIRSSAKPQMTASPDTLIDWLLIEQINIQTTEEPQCPICLYPPVAAKLTRCGHVYCWPCLLHYLSLSDKAWRKCPICYEAIHATDLKSCSIMQQFPLNVSDGITFQLMRRRKGSMFIEPYNAHSEHGANERFPLLCRDDDAKRFSKFIIARRADIVEILERERRELTTDEDATCPEYVFIQTALAMLNERREKLGIIVDLKEEEEEDEFEYVENIKVDEGERKEEETNSEKLIPADANEQDMLTEIEHKSESSGEIIATASPGGNGKFYYFYQSNDGQNIYLHPLNVKMLQACYGTLDHAPLIIEARILQKEQHSMDEEHRRKFTCLGHLPLTCQFAVVEVDLQPPIVTGGILKLFKDDLLRRRQERQRRDREERKREKQINEINDRQMGKLIASAANLNLSSVQEFPTCGYDDAFSTLNVDMPPLPRSSINNNESAASAASSYSSIAITAESPKQEYWPTIGAGAGISGSPTAMRSLGDYAHAGGAWGRAAPPPPTKTAASNAAVLASRNLLSDDGDEWRPMTTRLGDVLAEALTQKQQKPGTGAASRKKQKKSKKMTPIFATGMNYNGN